MATHRRRFLRLCGVAGLGAIAGCSDSAGDGTPTGDQATTTATPTTTESPVQNLTQQAKLAADDGDSGDEFGGSVALSSDGATALVSAPDDFAGSAYVFDRAGSSWTQQAKLTSDDSEDNDKFGDSVALSRDGATALIGAPSDQAGSAYVFDRAGGSWTQQAKLAADDGDIGDDFGQPVALSSDGTTALIGAWSDEDPNGDDAGSACVFDSSGGSWTQQAKLVPDDGDSGDWFSYSVTLSSDGATALIGALSDDNANGEGAGSAYVFDSSGGSWTQQAKLAADDGDSFCGFGGSVALSSDGTTALISAQSDDNANGLAAGSAYVFDRAGGSWTQQTKLTADDGDDNDYFGFSVALSGDGTTALIGAEKDEDPNGTRAGSAYIFDGSDSSWTQQAKLAADDGDSEDYFGVPVTLSSDGATALIGARGDEEPNGDDAGAAYVFE